MLSRKLALGSSAASIVAWIPIIMLVTGCASPPSGLKTGIAGSGSGEKTRANSQPTIASSHAVD